MVDVNAFHHTSYDMLKTLVKDESDTCHNLEELKDVFANDIGSVRRMESIHSIIDLMDCLERRDALNEYNIDVLRELADKMDNPKLQKSVASYVTPKEITTAEPLNLYQEYRLASNIKHTVQNKTLGSNISTRIEPSLVQELKSNTAVPACAAVPFTGKQRTAVYKLLSRNIGSSWRFFGRELSIGEGDMDAVETQFPNDLASRIMKLLKMFEEDEWQIEADHLRSICRALDACGRKDLRRNVLQIMSQTS